MDALLRGYASAISFQVFFALIPLGLFALALLGFLSLEEVWRDDIAPDVRENVSKAAFTIIDDTVNEILGRSLATVIVTMEYLYLSSIGSCSSPESRSTRL